MKIRLATLGVFLASIMVSFMADDMKIRLAALCVALLVGAMIIGAVIVASVMDLWERMEPPHGP